MICVKLTAFCDLRADLRIRLATLLKSVRKFWFRKLALTCESVWPGLNTDGEKVRAKRLWGFSCSDGEYESPITDL